MTKENGNSSENFAVCFGNLSRPVRGAVGLKSCHRQVRSPSLFFFFFSFGMLLAFHFALFSSCLRDFRALCLWLTLLQLIYLFAISYNFHEISGAQKRKGGGKAVIGVVGGAVGGAGAEEVRTLIHPLRRIGNWQFILIAMHSGIVCILKFRQMHRVTIGMLARYTL